ncbi:MAG: serine hydrolase [Gammaproteobacteria bacterium]|nr:serine hydrolase [Gammaproteobacteria bacterium]
MTAQSKHSCQSTTKTMLNLLVGQAVQHGKLKLNANIEKYLPNMGSGYKNQTIANILAMNVKHELNEIASYGGENKNLFEKEESSAGWLPSKFTPLNRRQFIASLKAGNLDGTNINRTGKYFYASPNTDLGAWVVERATGVSTQQAVRNILHAIGGENTIYMVTDKIGVPIVMGGLILTARDFSRYGMLLMSGGKSVNGQIVGGGKAFIRDTMNNNKVSMGVKDWYYANSVYVSPYGFGHAGWGGQWLWVDPKSKTVIIVFSSLMGSSPADPQYAKLLVQLTTEVVTYNRDLKLK